MSLKIVPFLVSFSIEIIVQYAALPARPKDIIEKSEVLLRLTAEEGGGAGYAPV
jgi:hypothetical protein